MAIARSALGKEKGGVVIKEDIWGVAGSSSNNSGTLANPRERRVQPEGSVAFNGRDDLYSVVVTGAFEMLGTGHDRQACAPGNLISARQPSTKSGPDKGSGR